MANYNDVIVVENVRLAHASLCLTEKEKADKQAKKTGEAKNWKDKTSSVTALIGKDSEQRKQIEAECCSVADVANVSELVAYPLVNQARKLKDGDLKEDEAYKGNVYLSCGSDMPVEFAKIEGGEVVLMQSEEARKEIYSGCYANLILQACEYKPGHTTLYLKGIMKVGEGEKLTTSVDTTAVFAKYGKIKTQEAPKAEVVEPAKEVEVAEVVEPAKEVEVAKPKAAAVNPLQAVTPLQAGKKKPDLSSVLG
jgi:hypothetical protein